MPATPTIITQPPIPPGTAFDGVDSSLGRLVYFQEFQPPQIKTGPRPCDTRPPNVTEFTAYYTSLMLPLTYDTLWIAERVATPTPCGRQRSWGPGPFVYSAGIIYKNGVMLYVWTGSSWTIVWPVRKQIFPSWMTQPNYMTFKR